MAICKTGCTNNTDICEGGALCCIGFENGCSEGCTDLEPGQSRIGFDNNGDLVTWSNIGGVCTATIIAGGAPLDICAELAACDLEDLGNVTAGAVAGQGLTFDGTDWVPTTLATGNSDSLVDGGNGTYIHTAVDGLPTLIDICGDLVHCTLQQIGDVTGGATPGQVLIYDGTNWIPTNQGGTDTLVNNGGGTFTHTSVSGVPVIIDICANLDFCTVENLGNVAAGATPGQVLVYNGANWLPTTVMAGTDTLVNNGDGSFTHTSISGVPVIIDICANLDFCTVENLGNVAAGATPGQVFVYNGTDWIPDNIGPIVIDRDIGASTAGGNTITIDIDGNGFIDFEFCEGFCELLSANDCVNGGVGVDYMLREFTIANDVLTVNSAPEHTTVAVTGIRTATVPGPGNPSTVALQLVDQNTATLTITNPSLCREMSVHIVASGKVDIRDMNLAVPTSGGTYTSRLQLDSSQSGANIRAIGTKFPSPWPNTTPLLLRDGKSDSLSFTETIPPGATVTYTAISQLRSDVAGFPVVATESGTQLTAFGSTI